MSWHAIGVAAECARRNSSVRGWVRWIATSHGPVRAKMYFSDGDFFVHREPGKGPFVVSHRNGMRLITLLSREEAETFAADLPSAPLNTWFYCGAALVGALERVGLRQRRAPDAPRLGDFLLARMGGGQ